MTDFHEYSLPTKGTSDWHIPLNSNFDQIDTDIEIRDAESEIEGYTPKSGAKFYSTDTGNVYIGNGDGWIMLPWTGENPSFSSFSTNARDTRVFYVDTESSLRTVVEDSNAPVRIIITDDITISQAIQWDTLPHESIVEGDGHPIITFDGSEAAYTNGHPLLFDGQRGIVFRDIEIQTTATGKSIIYFAGQASNSFQFIFDHVTFRPKGGGPAINAEDQSFFHQFRNCKFNHLQSSAHAYVMLGGTHIQHYGSRFLNIPDDSFGVSVTENMGGTGHLLFACKFGSLDQSGSGIDWRNKLGDKVRKNNGAILGCSFENLSAGSSNGQVGIRSGGDVLISGCMYKTVPTFIELAYATSHRVTTAIGNNSSGDGVQDYVIDASNGNEHVAWTDEPLGNHNDPDNLIYGQTREGIVTVSPDGSMKKVLGIDNDGNVTVRNT